MAEKRKVEIFSAGCPVCDEAVEKVREAACPDCDVEILDVRREAAARKAADYGVRSVPAVAIDGRLTDCCAGRGPEISALIAAGLGRPRA